MIPHHPIPQTASTLGIHADPVIFEPLNQIQLSRSTYMVTSYVIFTPYLHFFSKFETHLINVTDDLNSPVFDPLP